jgi:hypothetical protein
MVMALLPAGVASAQEPVQPRDLDDVCRPPYDSGFGDVDDANVHEEAILCMADYGLTEGLAPDGRNFGPARAVTRQQMASFIARFIDDATDGELPPGDGDRFDDADDFAEAHADNINALAGIGVVEGTGVSQGSEFAPGLRITRAQAASFIRRALSYLDDGQVNPLSAPPSNDGGFFIDEDRFPDAHADNIDALAGVEIAAGDLLRRFNPQRAIQRDQMASFVMRAYDYVMADFDMRTETFEVPLSWLNELDDSGDVPVYAQGQPGATGTSLISVRERTNTIDFEVDFSEVRGPFGDAPGFHIHAGAIDENGGVEVTLATGPELDDAEDRTLEGSVDAGEFDVSDLLDDPESYYLNLHSDDYPPGAIRGQLPDGGQRDLPPIDLDRIDVQPEDDGTIGQGDELGFVASGLDEREEYRVTLVDGDNVMIDEDGAVTFAESDDDGVRVADGGPPESYLTEVQGEAFEPDEGDPAHTVGGVAPDEDGEIAFTAEGAFDLDAEELEEGFIAVVSVDGGASTFLELDEDGAPIELFGHSRAVEVSLSGVLNTRTEAITETIAEAIDAAEEEDELIAGGEFAEEVVIDVEGLELFGFGATLLPFEGIGGADAVVTIDADFVTVGNLDVVDGVDGVYPTHIEVDADNAAVWGNTLTREFEDDADADTNAGNPLIHVDDEDGAIIEDNVLVGGPIGGQVSSDRIIDIVGNSVTTVVDEGIWLVNGGGNRITIEDNEVDDHDRGGDDRAELKLTAVPATIGDEDTADAQTAADLILGANPAVDSVEVADEVVTRDG